MGQLRETTLTFLCVTYYYAAYANYFSQASLPSPESYDETNDYHRLVRQLLDLSSADFRIAANVLEQWFSDEPSFIQNHRLTFLITEGQLVKDLIRTSAQRFEELRAEQAVPPST